MIGAVTTNAIGETYFAGNTEQRSRQSAECQRHGRS